MEGCETTFWHFQANKISDINGKTENVEIAEEINQFYTDIGPTLAREIPDSVLDMDFTFRADYPKFDFTLMRQL